MKICSTPGCEKKSRSRGLYACHYNQFRKTEGFFKIQFPNGESCLVPGCDKEPSAKGYCTKHYCAFKKHGDPEGGQKRPVPRTDGLKVCPKCKLPKEGAEFNKSSEGELQGYCRACMRIWNQENKVKKRAYARVAYYKDLQKTHARDRKSKLWCNFRITPEDYSRMVAAQKGVCAICGLPEHTNRRLAVDHNHATGEVRGLLCSFCNPGVGLFKDSVTLLSAAIEYLKRAESDSGTE